MADTEKFPRLAHDLVDWLDEFVGTPTFPLTPQAVARMDDESVRLASFQAGARNLVNQLIAWRAELDNEEDDKGDEGGHSIARVLGDDLKVHEETFPVSLGKDHA